MEIAIAKIIKRLENKRATGPGGIHNELIEFGTPKLWRTIKIIFEKYINGQQYHMKGMEDKSLL